MINLTVTTPEPTTGTDRTPQYDWVTVGTALGPRVHTAWERAQYGMFRADNGKGAVPTGVVIPATGTAWATVCEHLTVRPVSTGGAAERAGKARTLWCDHCAAGTPGTAPLTGSQAPTAPASTTTAQQTPAEPATPAPAEDVKAREGMTADKRKAIAAAQR